MVIPKGTNVLIFNLSMVVSAEIDTKSFVEYDLTESTSWFKYERKSNPRGRDDEGRPEPDGLPGGGLALQPQHGADPHRDHQQGLAHVPEKWPPVSRLREATAPPVMVG